MLKNNTHKLTFFLFSCVLIAYKGTVAIPDNSFGFIGGGGPQFAERFGLQYYTLEGNYPSGSGKFYSVDPALDPLPGHSVIREVAKLNQRVDGLGETNEQFEARLTDYATNLALWYLTPSILRESKPVLSWYHPDAAALASAEGPEIIATIRREKSADPQITGTVWEIGNEPNMFPIITPEEYAAIFTAYYNLIKTEDPSAVVALGSFFLHELAPDLRARMELVMEQEFKAAMMEAGYYNSLNSAGVYDDLLSDIKTSVFGKIYGYQTWQYFQAVLDALPSGVTPDIITIHTYPFYDLPLSSMLQGLRANSLLALGTITSTMASNNLSVPLWISEFGNIKEGLTAGEVSAQTDTLISIFREVTVIEKWFYYKPVGKDQALALFSSGGEVITRLASDSNFVPADGNFSCDELNEIGEMYYLRSNGHICRDLPDGNLLSSPVLDTAFEEERYLYTVTRTDPDLPLVITFETLPSWMQSDGDSAWGVPDDPVSDTIIMVTASIDDRVDTLNVVIKVIQSNDAPVITFMDTLPGVLTEGESAEFSAGAEDAEGDSIHYIWVINGDTAGTGNTFVYSPVYPEAGVKTVKLYAVDPAGAYDSKSFEITVNDGPLAAPILNIPEGNEISDTSVLSWSWPPEYDPGLKYDPVWIRLKVFEDSMLTSQIVRLDSINGDTILVADLGIPDRHKGGAIWVTLRTETEKQNSDWSVPVKLEYLDDVTDLDGMEPLYFHLGRNVPNPLISATTINFTIPYTSKGCRVSIKLFNMRGKLLRVLADSPYAAGIHAITFAGTDSYNRKLLPGNYIVKMTAGEFRQSRIITLVD